MGAPVSVPVSSLVRSLVRSLSHPLSLLRRVSWICALLVLLPSLSPGQGGSADEYQIRAAMLFNLTRFIDWPPSKLDQSHPQFVFCILGSDPIGANLDTVLRSKTVGSKPVELRHVSSPEAARDCHVLYIGAAEHKSFLRASAELARNGVLTVSERSNADAPGQMVGLPVIDEHVRIEVNLGLVQRSGLSMSSKLLHLATVSY